MSRRFCRAAVLVLCGIMLLCLILDGQTALQSAYEGVQISIYTIIPTLLPYIFLSSLLCSAVLGTKIPLLDKLARLCGIPAGAESILLLGLVGGYPVGAKLITDSYNKGQLSKSAAQSMLGFCSNAGPSFIIGILSAMFSNPAAPWLIWIVHILSAVLVGILLPNKERTSIIIPKASPPDPTSALVQAIKSVAMICGWVILFRILLGFMNKWLLFRLPTAIQITLTGIIELTNGCLGLQQISNESVRLPIAAMLLAWGGLCVTMQTASATKGLGLGMYIPGKMLQTFITLILIVPASTILYGNEFSIWSIMTVAAAAFAASICMICMYKHKKVVAFS